MPPPAQSQPAYVLHRRAFRETSAIVELLTRDHGRVAGVVRGVRGSRRAGHGIEPFGLVQATWRGRGQLVTVSRCESVDPRRLTGDRLFAGLYLNELLLKTLDADEPMTALFHDYGRTLARMADAGPDQGGGLEGALRDFERRLLEELGYGLVFDIDVGSGRAIAHDKTYRIVHGEGFSECAPGAGEQRSLISGRLIAAIDAGDYAAPAVRRAAKRIFRHALELRLGGRRLATRKLASALAEAPTLAPVRG